MQLLERVIFKKGDTIVSYSRYDNEERFYVYIGYGKFITYTAAEIVDMPLEEEQVIFTIRQSTDNSSTEPLKIPSKFKKFAPLLTALSETLNEGAPTICDDTAGCGNNIDALPNGSIVVTEDDCNMHILYIKIGTDAWFCFPTLEEELIYIEAQDSVLEGIELYNNPIEAMKEVTGVE